MKKLENVKLINLTPHKLNLLNEKKETILELESQGSIRLSTKIETIGSVNWISLTQTVFGDTQLPKQKEDTFYIVSLPIWQYAKQQGRDDFLIPGELVRDEDRRTILWMKSLAVL